MNKETTLNEPNYLQQNMQSYKLKITIIFATLII